MTHITSNTYPGRDGGWMNRLSPGWQVFVMLSPFPLIFVTFVLILCIGLAPHRKDDIVYWQQRAANLEEADAWRRDILTCRAQINTVSSAADLPAACVRDIARNLVR